jgi:hypothetical protein
MVMQQGGFVGAPQYALPQPQGYAGQPQQQMYASNPVIYGQQGVMQPQQQQHFNGRPQQMPMSGNYMQQPPQQQQQAIYMPQPQQGGFMPLPQQQQQQRGSVISQPGLYMPQQRGSYMPSQSPPSPSPQGYMQPPGQQNGYAQLNSPAPQQQQQQRFPPSYDAARPPPSAFPPPPPGLYAVPGEYERRQAAEAVLEAQRKRDRDDPEMMAPQIAIEGDEEAEGYRRDA